MRGEAMLLKVVEFLNEIGIEAKIEQGAHGFVKHARITNGSLAIDPACPVGDVLHEAGHIAITPARYRRLLDGDIQWGIRKAWEDAERFNLGPDDPLMRALIQCSDPEATAWAWAAGLHIGLAPEQIIYDSDDPFHYGGEAWSVRQAHEMGYSLGAHGLAHAGFCQVGMYNRFNPLPKYPQLAFWTQQA